VTPQQPRLPLDPPDPWRPDRLLAQADLTREQRDRVTREAGRRALPWTVVWQELDKEGKV
jgi:hypothetical protein